MYVVRRRGELGAADPLRVLDPVPDKLRYRFKLWRGGAHEGDVPEGDAGTFFTLGIMRELVARDVALLAPAVSRILSRSTTGNPLAAIRRFLAQRVRFTRDPNGVELLKAPAYQLAAIRARGSVTGDCDDIAILGAALGIAAGFPARFVVLRFDPTGPYEHVFTELRGPTGWVELDTSRELQRVPADVVRSAERSTFDVGAPDGLRQRVRV